MKDTIKADMISAMKAKDKLTLGTIRMLMAAIKQKEIDEQITLDDAAVLGVVNKMIKQRRDSIEQFTKGGRQDLVDQESAEINVLEQYLPEQLSAEEVEQAVTKAIADSGASAMKDMGKVMGILKPALTGKADMGAVSKLVKEKLAGA